jgi:hypothetical protein
MSKLFIRIQVIEAETGDPWALEVGRVRDDWTAEMGSAETGKVQFTTGRLFESAKQLINNG